MGFTNQISGTTPNNFTSPVTYSVTAQDGTTVKNWIVTVTVLASTLAIYSDSGYASPCTSFASSVNHVYVKGTNFGAGNYRVNYYDGSGSMTWSQDNVVVDSTGILLSDYSLKQDKNAAPGTWYILVQPSAGTTNFGTNTYDTIITSSATYGVLASNSFSAASSAIPEFPNAVAAVGVLGLCVGAFFWMRRTLLKS